MGIVGSVPLSGLLSAEDPPLLIPEDVGTDGSIITDASSSLGIAAPVPGVPMLIFWGFRLANPGGIGDI